MPLEPVKGTAPDYWACYLINGDSDYLSEEERAAADKFAEWLGAMPCDCEDAGFIWRPDSFRFWPYGATCQEYTALIQTEEATQ